MKVMRHLVTALAVTAATVALASFAPTVAQAQIGVEVNITAAPPPRKVEVQYASPGAEYVWHRGDWVYNPERGEYLWHPGHWVIRPDAEHSVWFPGDWVNFAGGWRYVTGHWRTPSEGPPPDYAKLVEVIKEPPTLQVEATPAPLAGYAWDRGHWAWDGAGYRWVRGHWLITPKEFHYWQPGHWYHSGTYYFFHPGFWH
jgi:WXXGXW repeat (2 copies)